MDTLSIKSARVQAWMQESLGRTTTAFFRLIDDSAVAPFVLRITAPFERVTAFIRCFHVGRFSQHSDETKQAAK
jgi:hypothetical protein